MTLPGLAPPRLLGACIAAAGVLAACGGGARPAASPGAHPRPQPAAVAHAGTPEVDAQLAAVRELTSPPRSRVASPICLMLMRDGREARPDASIIRSLTTRARRAMQIDVCPKGKTSWIVVEPIRTDSSRPAPPSPPPAPDPVRLRVRSVEPGRDGGFVIRIDTGAELWETDYRCTVSMDGKRAAAVACVPVGGWIS